MPNTRHENNIDENMKIKYTTYEARRDAKSPRPTSSSRKVQDFFSSYISHCKEKDGESLIQPVTASPSSAQENISPSVGRLTEKRAAQKQRMREQKAAENSQPLTEVKSKVEDKELLPTPKLRRRGKFSDIVREMGNKPSAKSNTGGRRSAVEDIADMHAMRSAMREGKIERVVQRPRSGYRSPRSPPGVEEDLLQIPSTASPQPSYQRSKSTANSSKLAEYIGTSADILDSTRRELTRDLAGKFKPPFEHLNCHPFSRSNRDSYVSSDSSSFFCAGELHEQRDNEEAVAALKEGQRQSWETFGRRLSGEGTDPWVDKAPRFCRLCKKVGVMGIRGLCEVCERDFMWPQTHALTTPSSDDDEIKPTPPLKDKKKKLSSANTQTINQKSAHRDLDEGGKGKSKIPIKVPRVSRVDSRPTTIEPIPKRQSSQRAAVIEVQAEDEEEKYRRWQAESVRVEFVRMQELFERWSDCFAADNYGGFEGYGEHGDHVPLIRGSNGKEKGGEGTVDRNSEFYGYWDDVLMD